MFIKGSLPLLLVVGIAVGVTALQGTVHADAQASSGSAEVSVTIKIPDDETLTGTAIIVIEDISLQDAPSVELARLEVPAASLVDNQAAVSIPIDVQSVDPDATINVAVLIDADDSGAMSAGDWISDSLVPVINNLIMKVSVDVVKI